MSRRAGALALALLAAGCAKSLPPPGGQRDVNPPRVLTTVPDSGAVGVARKPELSITFSERMDQVTTGERILIAPAVRTSLKWRDHSVFVTLLDSLAPSRTYALIVGGRALDERGNALGAPHLTLFTTADSFPPGEIRGAIQAFGHAPGNLYVWAYRADLGHRPDSTARDYDALAQSGPDGSFRFPGLEVPSRWALYAFHDANRTLTFEPGIDHLTARREEIVLTAASPRADSVRVRSVDPLAPGEARGTVADTTGLGAGLLRLIAESVADSTAGQVPVAARRADVVVNPPEFVVSLPPGRYRIRLYIDDNRNRRFEAAADRAGPPVEVTLEAGDTVRDLTLAMPPL